MAEGSKEEVDCDPSDFAGANSEAAVMDSSGQGFTMK